MSAGKSIRLFLADGSPGGLLTAEIMNWTGHVIAAPRSDLGELLKRPEATRTGVYLLLGDDPDGTGSNAAYIGEADDVSKRLYLHSRPAEQGGKDFWDRVVVLTSKDANLTKAHVRYLESRFITLATHAGRAKLVNGTSPDPVALPEADVSDMEYYIEQARIVLPVLGINLLRTTERKPVASVASNAPEPGTSTMFTMELKREGIIASANLVDGEFTVLEGSGARREWVGVPVHNYTVLRDKLEQDGTLNPSADGRTMRFARDYAFTSPSAAAAVVAGRSANGRKEWLAQGSRLTYGEWENQNIDAAVATATSSVTDTLETS